MGKMKNLGRILGCGLIVLGLLACAEHPNENKSVEEVDLNENIKFQSVKDYTPFVNQGQKMVHETQGVMAQKLMGAMSEGGPINAIEFCNKNVAGISDSLSQFHGAQISRASDKPRNPSNKASDVEIKSIDSLKALKAAGASLTPISFETENQVITHYPIPTAGMCLKCHADTQKTISSAVQQKLQSLYPEDMATGYQVGDIRGIWVVKMDKDIQK